MALIYGITFCGLLILLSDTLCLTLYGRADAARYLRWYSPLVPMLYCDAITDAMTKGLGQQKICVRYNILTSFLDVVFLYILLPRYGMEGYFASFLVTHVLNFGLSLNRLMKITGIRIPVRVPACSAVAMLIAAWPVSHLRGAAARSAAYLLVLGSLLFLLGVLKRRDVIWVKGLLRKKDPTAR